MTESEPGWTVRQATADEVSEIVELVNDAYGRTDAPSGWTSEEGIVAGPRVRPEDVRELLDREASELLVAHVGEELVGCVLLEEREGATSELGLLSVRPERQAEGIGRRLLEAGEAHARKAQGAERIELHVVSVREELAAWYERRGYERTGEEVSFEPGGDQRSLQGQLSFVVLEKRLP